MATLSFGGVPGISEEAGGIVLMLEDDEGWVERGDG